PFYYRITGVWGALEGSIILWTWMLALYTLIVILRHRESARELYPWVLTVMLGVLAFFLLVITVAAPPFARLHPVPADGHGLNPLLEDTGMITRSEEHTSELQSRGHLVCRLLLEKKKRHSETQQR